MKEDAALITDLVVRRHVDILMEREPAALGALMDDYAADAVAITTKGLFLGEAGIRGMLQTALQQPRPQGNFEANYKAVAPDSIIVHFTMNRGTPTEISGAELFVVRDEKIVFQALLPPSAY